MGKHKRISNREKSVIIKSFKDAEDRIMKLIKARMIELSKDEKIKKKMLKEIHATLNIKPKK